MIHGDEGCRGSGARVLCVRECPQQGGARSGNHHSLRPNQQTERRSVSFQALLSSSSTHGTLWARASSYLIVGHFHPLIATHMPSFPPTCPPRSVRTMHIYIYMYPHPLSNLFLSLLVLFFIISLISSCNISRTVQPPIQLTALQPVFPASLPFLLPPCSAFTPQILDSATQRPLAFQCLYDLRLCQW
jgi:hypothetical protein